MSRRLALPVLLLCLIAPSGALAMGAAGASPPKASLLTIERQVMCVTCKIPLNVAQSPQAEREKAFIKAKRRSSANWSPSTARRCSVCRPPRAST